MAYTGHNQKPQAMPQERKQRPRQEPVSCESCRKKKLKCSREQPCLSGLARDVACDFQGRKVSAVMPTAVPSPGDVTALRADNGAIKARIDRLEEIIFSSNYQTETDTRPAKARRLLERVKSSDGLASPATTVSNSTDPEVAKTYRGDVQWLEGVGTRENTRLPHLSAPFEIKVILLEHILQQAAFPTHHERCIFLPHETEALQLFDCYAKRLEPVQHLLHIPTAYDSVKRLYQQLHLGEHVEPSQTLLLTATMSSIAFYLGLSECDSCIFGSKQAAIDVAVLWLRVALDILEHVRRSASPSLETVQAGIIIPFLVYHIEGFTPKVRSMVYAALAAAKDLGLHRTDDASYTRQQDLQSDVVEKEVRRRVWWHLASTDWSLALGGGAHEGTYTVNPRHMKVRRPRNISDEELAMMPADFERPLSEPTIMAYYLQRIKLAKICRHIADVTWDVEADKITAEEIRAIDTEFEVLLAELPTFLRLDRAHGESYQQAERVHSPIRLQRYIINSMTYAKRCKFHLPFLLRASNDSDYTFSRGACLHAARAVIQLRKELSNEPGESWITSARLCGILHLFFYATMVLVMDFCVNRTSGCDSARKAEIQDACKTLEDAKQQSGAAGMFLDSLTSILRKHRVPLQNQEIREPESSTYGRSTYPKAAETDALAPGRNHHSLKGSMTSGLQSFNDLEFDELWHSYINMESTIDPHSWGALMSDIDYLYHGSEH